MANKLPKIVYVYLDDDTDDEDRPYILAHHTLRDCADLDEDRLVGVYELRKTESVHTEVITSQK